MSSTASRKAKQKTVRVWQINSDKTKANIRISLHDISSQENGTKELAKIRIQVIHLKVMARTDYVQFASISASCLPVYCTHVSPKLPPKVGFWPNHKTEDY